MTVDNERILKDLAFNLRTITSRLDGIAKAETVPSELESRIEELKAYVILTFSQFSGLLNILAKLGRYLKTLPLENDPSCRRWL